MKKNNRHAANLFKLLDKGLTILDVGATGGIQGRWQPFKSFLNYIGVEADERAGDYIGNKGEYRSQLAINTFAWSSATKIDFNLCEKPDVSSAFEPNMDLIQQYPNPKRFSTAKKVQLETSRLETCLSNHEVDFIKLDVHGAELDIIEGLGSSFNSCLGIEIEIVFTEIYKNQKLFGDINNFLISNGFFFLDFVNLYRWERQELSSFGRCVFGDGLWLRDIQKIRNITTEHILKYVAICVSYGRLDEAKHALESNDLASEKLEKARGFIHELIKVQSNKRKYFNLVRKFAYKLAPDHALHWLY